MSMNMSEGQLKKQPKENFSLKAKLYILHVTTFFSPTSVLEKKCVSLGKYDRWKVSATTSPLPVLESSCHTLLSFLIVKSGVFSQKAKDPLFFLK
jgi:hypothetical protein